MHASEDLMVYLLLSLLILPSIAWVFLENRSWENDAVEYAGYSIESNRRLFSDSIFTWLDSMFTRYRVKPPLLMWVGQWFVPLGVFLGPVRKGLLFAPIVFSLLSVFISYTAFKRMFNDRLIALAGAVFISASPLFIGLSTRFLTEPLLLLVVVWSMYVYASYLSWDRYYALLHLLSVFFVSLLTKFSGPFYLILPSIVILYHVFRLGFGVFFMELRQTAAKHAGMAAVTLFLFSLTSRLYYLNVRHYLNHANNALSGKWVLNQTFIESMARLLRESAGVFFLDYSVFFFLILASAGLFHLRKSVTVRNSPQAVVFPLQILLVLLVIGYLRLTDPWRFVFPVLPYVAAVMCWSLRIIGRKTVTMLAIVVFLLQAILLHSYAFGILRDYPQTPHLGIPFTHYHLTPYYQPGIMGDYNRLLDVLCNHSSQNTVLLTRGKNWQYWSASKTLWLYSTDRYSDKCQFINYPRKNESYLKQLANRTDYYAVIYDYLMETNGTNNLSLSNEFGPCMSLNLTPYNNIKTVSTSSSIKLCGNYSAFKPALS